MSYWSKIGEYLLPWKAIPNMASDVKDAFKGEGDNRHDSFMGAIGKYADPAGALLGDKWMDFWHGTVPREVNRALEPVGEFHRDYLDPIWMLGGKDTEWGKAITDQGVNKGGDWSAAILGSILGGGAIAGGAGAGTGGGGAGGAAAAGGGGGGSLSVGGVSVNPWLTAMGQVGGALQRAGAPQPMQPAATGPQAPSFAGDTRDPMTALKLMMQETQQAGSLDELAERLAQYGEPPSFGNPEAMQQPAVVVNTAPPAPQLPQSGQLPKTPQTRGEAQTDVNLGQLLGGFNG